jgi:hypothetical protein
MPFSGDTFTKLYNWLTDPQRNEKIFNSRLDDEFGGIATGLTTVSTDLSTVEAGAVRFDTVQAATAAQQAVARSNISAALKGHIFGLTLSNNVGDATNDIDIAAGEASSTETNPQLMALSALTKRLDADWVAGTNQGMRNSAAAITDTTYHIYLVSKANGADADIYAHTSATAATVLTALQAETGGTLYVHARRIGSIVRISAAIGVFSQRADEFLWSVPVVDVALGTATSTAGALVTTTVPTGIVVDTIVALRLDWTSAGNFTLWTSPDQANTAPGGNANSAGQTAENTLIVINTRIRTNTSGQIRQRSDSTTIQYGVQTHGWVDTRGRHV